jgi:hypothetical protein
MAGILMSELFLDRFGEQLRRAAVDAGIDFEPITLPPDPDERLSDEECERIEVASYSLDLIESPHARSFFSSLYRAPSLEWMHVRNAGVDHPVFGRLLERGITLTNSAGAAAEPIAQSSIAALLAAFAVAVAWGVQLQGELDTLREESTALQVAVASDSSRIDALDRELVSGGDQVLRAELNRVRTTHQRTVAILADPNVWTAELASAEAGHGASGRFVWSPGQRSGVLVAEALPSLPLETLYEVWLDDGERVISVGAFLPSADGATQVLIEPGIAFEPRSVTVATAPPGGAGSLQPPIVISGAIVR